MGRLKVNKNPNLTIFLGIFILIMIVISCTFANAIAPFSPIEQNPVDRLKSPNLTHLMGTDQFGRDVFSRVLYGGRRTLVAALLATVVNTLLGTALGLIAGYYHGKLVDRIIMRIVDCLVAFPFIVLAMIITSLFGTGLVHLLIAIAIVWWIPFARLSRSVTLKYKEEPEILAAKVAGASDVIIMIRELLPRIFSPAFILATFKLGSLILSMSALSFFGLGAKPPTPEWGSMLSDSKAYFFQAPYLIIGICIFIFFTVLSLNLIGEGLRDKLDPFEIIEI